MIRVFCDFDGTVCPADVGAEFFRTFAGATAREYEEASQQGLLAVHEWMQRLCAAVPSMRREEFDAFIDRFAVDEHFPPFAEFVRERGMSITILSDGLDAYIERILSRADLSAVPYYANHAVWIGENGMRKFSLQLPYTDAECSQCGNCKRNHILTSCADDDVIVYAGDGYSDRCPVRYADVVFAKGQLIAFCQEQNITYTPFRHFGEIRMKMEQIAGMKRIRHRREAAMARREAFMQE